MNFALLNHRTEVAKLAEIVTNRNTYGIAMYALDVNTWGVDKPFSDPENSTIYRRTLLELSNDTFVSEDEEMNYTHYPNAQHGSIWDY